MATKREASAPACAPRRSSSGVRLAGADPPPTAPADCKLTSAENAEVWGRPGADARDVGVGRRDAQRALRGHREAVDELAARAGLPEPWCRRRLSTCASRSARQRVEDTAVRLSPAAPGDRALGASRRRRRGTAGGAWEASRGDELRGCALHGSCEARASRTTGGCGGDVAPARRRLRRGSAPPRLTVGDLATRGGAIDAELHAAVAGGGTARSGRG